MEESTAGSNGEAVQGAASEEFVSGPRPRLYHQQRDGDLQKALLGTLQTDAAIRFSVEGLTKGKIQSLKNRCYRSGKRLQAEFPALKLRTRISEGFLCVWLEQ